MKIAIDARVATRGGTSGIEEYTRQLVSRLIEDPSHHYQIFLSGIRPKTIPPLWRSAPNASIIDWNIPNQLLDISSRIFKKPAIDRVLGSDVVFSPHFNIIHSARAPRVITFHDLSFLHHPDFFGAKQKLWHWRQDYIRQSTRAAHFIAVSEFTKSDLVKLLGIPPERVTVVYSGIDDALRPLPPQDPGILAFKEKYRLSYPYFLYLGTLEPRKNIPAIIQAFDILKLRPEFKDHRLILAGRPGWLYRDIFKAAARAIHKNHILFWGQAAHSEKIFLYNSAEAFVYPSFFEGFGFPPLEAQACGIPAVISDRTSLPEIVGTSALLVNPWNVHDLADALASAGIRSASRETLIAAGLKNVEKFNWHAAALQTKAVFEHVYNEDIRHSPAQTAEE